MKICRVITFMVVALFLYASQAGASDQNIIQEKVGNGSFNPKNPPPVSYRDSDLEVLPAYNGNQISLQIESRTSPAVLVALPGEMAQLSEVRPVYGNRIVAIGLANSAISVVTIIDRKKGEVIDTFWCYKPSISPDGRWIAFQEFFPAHFTEIVETKFRVYAISLGAKGNRPGITDISNETQLVGTVVYPLPSLGQEADTSDTSIDHVVGGTFFWWPQSEQFIFQIDEGKSLNLVLVKLRKNGKEWDTLLYDLNKDGSVCETTCELSRVTSFALSENAAVDVKVSPGQLGAKDLNFSIALDEFKRINR